MHVPYSDRIQGFPVRAKRTDRAVTDRICATVLDMDEKWETVIMRLKDKILL